MSDISWIHLVILILASFRLTHLIVYDKITAFIRNPFIALSDEYDQNGELKQVMQVKGTGLRHWIGSLLSCYWCTGVWSALAVVVMYACIPFVFPLLVILAVAGAAALIETRVP